MDHGFFFFIFIFAAALLLYAAVMAITKDYNMLPYRSRVSVKPKNPEKYTVQLAKAVALVAAAIAAGAAIALWNMAAGGAVMFVGVIAAIWSATKFVKND